MLISSPQNSHFSLADEIAFVRTPTLRRLTAVLGAAATNVEAGLVAWSASRKLRSASDGMLKDVGVSRGGIEWAVRHGRETNRH